MRIVLAATTVLIAISTWLGVDATPAMAQSRSYAWCAIYSGQSLGGSKNCSFNSMEQCQAQVSGVGGFCQPNYYYAGAQQVRRKTRRVHHHH